MQNTTLFKRQIILAAIVFSSAFTTNYSLVAQTKKSTKTDVKSVIEKSSARLDREIKTIVDVYRKKFREGCTKAKLEALASDVISIESKFQQLYSTVQDTNDRDKKIRKAIKRHLLNDDQLAKEMRESFEAFHDDMVAETIQLCRSHYKGNLSKLQCKTFELGDKSWDGLFQRYLLSTLKKFSNRDWARFLAITAGSGVASDLLVDSAREMGMFGYARGSMQDQAAKLLVEVLADAALSELTDPSASFASDVLKPHFDALEKAMFDDKSTGLLGVLTQAAEYHKSFRKKHLLSQKGVRK